MKKLITFVFISFAFLSVFAQRFKVGDFTYEINSDRKSVSMKIGKDNEFAKSFIIPYSVKYKRKDYVVSSIEFDDGMLPWRIDINSITIPSGVTSISDALWWLCKRLKSISVDGNNLSYTSISGVLYDKNIQTLICYPQGKDGEVFIIPNSVTSIGNSAFSDCSSLTSIIIPNSVTSIGNSAFFGCSSLTSITIPTSVTSIGNSAFSDCSSLTSIIIPNSVTSIGNSAFFGCSSLTSITITESLIDKINDAKILRIKSNDGSEMKVQVTNEK